MQRRIKPQGYSLNATHSAPDDSKISSLKRRTTETEQRYGTTVEHLCARSDNFFFVRRIVFADSGLEVRGTLVTYWQEISGKEP